MYLEENCNDNVMRKGYKLIINNKQFNFWQVPSYKGYNIPLKLLPKRCDNIDK